MLPRVERWDEWGPIPEGGYLRRLVLRWRTLMTGVLFDWLSGTDCVLRRAYYAARTVRGLRARGMAVPLGWWRQLRLLDRVTRAPPPQVAALGRYARRRAHGVETDPLLVEWNAAVPGDPRGSKISTHITRTRNHPKTNGICKNLQTGAGAQQGEQTLHRIREESGHD